MARGENRKREQGRLNGLRKSGSEGQGCAGQRRAGGRVGTEPSSCVVGAVTKPPFPLSHQPACLHPRLPLPLPSKIAIASLRAISCSHMTSPGPLCHPPLLPRLLHDAHLDGESIPEADFNAVASNFSMPMLSSVVHS